MVPLGFQYLAGVSIIVTWVLVIAVLWRRQRRMILLSAGLAAPHARQRSFWFHTIGARRAYSSSASPSKTYSS